MEPAPVTGRRRVNTSARFDFDIPPDAREAVLRDFGGTVLGRWQVVGGRLLTVDLLDDRVCLVDGECAPGPGVPGGFVAYPRMSIELGGVGHELVSGHPEVLHRHYNRPQHGGEMYWSPSPEVAAFHAGRVRQIRRLLEGVRGRLLDVGSGHSIVAGLGLPGVTVYACDRDLEPVRAMHDSGNAVAVLATADAVPLAPGGFDAVFAGEIVEHLVEPHAAVHQWVGLLRPGGRLVITTPNRTHIMARLLRREQVLNAEHLFEWSSDELLDAVRSSGARVVRREGLIMALPVPVPFKGWRDVVAGVQRRRDRPLPDWMLRLHVEAGRLFPGSAVDMALAAVRI